MDRLILAAAATITMAALSVPAHGQVMNSTSGNPRPFDSGTNHDSLAPAETREPRTFNLSETNQVRRWGEVGQCVARTDRASSLSLIAAPLRSPEADIAAKRLEPSFAACLSGMRVKTPGNPALRRAAVADALGVTMTE
jgi:hypothetical protein